MYVYMYVIIFIAQNNTNVVYEKLDNQLPSPYEEPLRTSTLASSDFYSEAGMTMNTIVHEKNSQQSTGNGHVRFYFHSCHIIL